MDQGLGPLLIMGCFLLLWGVAFGLLKLCEPLINSLEKRYREKQAASQKQAFEAEQQKFRSDITLAPGGVEAWHALSAAGDRLLAALNRDTLVITFNRNKPPS